MCQPNACQNMWVTWVIAFQPDTIRQYMSRCTRINPLFIWICCVATYPRAYYKKEICVQQGLSTVQCYTTVPEIIWGLRSCIVSMKPLWICSACRVTQSWPLTRYCVNGWHSLALNNRIQWRRCPSKQLMLCCHNTANCTKQAGTLR